MIANVISNRDEWRQGRVLVDIGGEEIWLRPIVGIDHYDDCGYYNVPGKGECVKVIEGKYYDGQSDYGKK